MSDSAGFKKRAQADVQSRKVELLEVGHEIHSNPELGFKEFKASQLLASRAETAGFEVEVGSGGLKTAFVATYGSGSKTVALCAEYDALPEIGHACGHNIIAASSLGAALALASVADDCDLTVKLIGTPAEEVGNAAGKIVLLEAGVFEGVDAAMMVHPAPDDVLRPLMIAAGMLDIEAIGNPSHAAFYPELGVNAADVMTVAQVGIGLLRQHILPTDRIHGILVKGGDAPNIIPALATARYMARSVRLANLEPLLKKVTNCFEAGALATGAEVRISGGDKPYADVRHNPDLSSWYGVNANALGRSFPESDGRPSGSTDMGNVSHVIPSIHPFIGIESSPAVNHQPGFTDAAAGESGDRAIVDGATALAWTGIDFALSPNL